MKRRGVISPPAIVAAAVAVYFGVFSALAPLTGDDLIFISDWNFYGDSGRCGFFETLARWIAYMRRFDNGRGDNVVAILCVACLPRFVAAAIAALSAAALVLILPRLTAPRGATGGREALLTALLLMVAMPWRDRGMSPVNMLNMLLPAAAMAGMLLALLRAPSLRGGAAWTATLVFCFLAGTLHEGYSAVALAGITAAWALGRRMPGRGSLAVVAAYAAGALVPLTAPAIFMRAHMEREPLGTIKGTITLSLPVIALAATVAFNALTRRGRGILRRLASDVMGRVLAVAFAAGMVIVCGGEYNNPRAWWLPGILAVAMTVPLAAPWLRRWPRAAVGATGVLLAAFGVNVLVEQYKATVIHDMLWEMAVKSPTGTVFRDFNPYVPHTTLLHPVKDTWFHPLFLTGANMRRDDGRVMCVVPEALAALTGAQARAVSTRATVAGMGEPDARGYRVFRGMILAPDREMTVTTWGGEVNRVPAMREQLTLILADGSRIENAPMIVQRFVAPSGERLLWIHTLLRLPAAVTGIDSSAPTTP